MLADTLKNYNVILATRSPRRRELFKGLDIPFSIAPNYDINETPPTSMRLLDVPSYLAESKSDQYPKPLAENDILITADTLVVCDNELMGKPMDRKDAIRMLHKLSNNKHEVLTGVCIRTTDKKRMFDVSTYVYFRRLKKSEIEYYVDNYQPYDMAGSYGVQEWLGYIAVERIEGSYYNVMGLPVQRLYAELMEFMDD
ncbi:MAG: Maf family nucleotide pyrophosphatase [Prevotellaceae bacterium]|jgi:septum formation protein|nr:Maf family nucleotide pyrophosphatase [Prevotellaceae bacterium]